MNVGDSVFVIVGFAEVDVKVGIKVGSSVGDSDGVALGFLVVFEVGIFVDLKDGLPEDGSAEGRYDGSIEGAFVTLDVGMREVGRPADGFRLGVADVLTKDGFADVLTKEGNLVGTLVDLADGDFVGLMLEGIDVGAIVGA